MGSPRPFRSRRFLQVGLAAAFALIAIAELLARHYGLHTPLLYETTGYGYRVKPNQDIRRFGNRIFYNQYGLRSEPNLPTPKPGVLRILCIGDSITNGGTISDQAVTYPYLLEKVLVDSGLRAEVLNASAGGWALANSQGWLNENGTLNAHIVVVEVATHDLFQPLAPAATVYHHPSFPGHRPLSGLQELVGRYALPRMFPALRAGDPGTEGANRDLSVAHAAVDRVIEMVGTVRGSGAVALVMQVEQPPPLEPNDPITHAAKQLLAAKLAALQVPIVWTSDAVARNGGTKLFRDAFHPNAAGNQVLAQSVAGVILDLDGVRKPPR